MSASTGWRAWSRGASKCAVAVLLAATGGWTSGSADAAMPQRARTATAAPMPASTTTAWPSTVAFESNAGQFDDRIAFVARGRGVTARLLDDGADFLLLSVPRDGGPDCVPTMNRDAGEPQIDRVRMRFAGGAPSRAQGEGLLPWRTNHFIGKDPADWRSDVAGYASARQASVWPGVDAVWRSSGRDLEYEFHAAPGADPARIAFRLEGAESLRVDDCDGSLVATTRLGTLRQSAPVAWDVTPSGRAPVAAAFRVSGDGLVSFDLRGHDAARPLVIDPRMDWATFVGGNSTDYPRGGSIDASGNVLLAGYTSSTNYPVGSAAQSTLKAGTDACVTKLSADGTQILFSTYLGGSNTDQAWDVLANAAGKTIVIGYTLSTDWPVTTGSIRTSYAGGSQDAFVTQLSATGAAIDWSTYLGGSALDSGYAVALDLAGDIYVTGYTASSDFPTQNARQPNYGGGAQDGFLAKIKSTGDAFVFSTFHGGAGDEIGFRVRVDETGSPYICGSTSSADFPLQNAYDTTLAGTFDSYVAKFNASGSALVYSTLIGGGNFDYAYTLTVDTKGFAAIGGVTASTDFPVTTPFQPNYGGGTIDGWVAKFAANGSSLLWASYYGGSQNDYIQSLALDDAGGCCFAGFTYSTDVVLKNPVQPSRGGASPTTYSDVLFGRTEPDGSALAYGSYYGGSLSEDCYGLALEPSGLVRLIGATGSSDLPVSGGVQTSFGGGSFDIFVARFSPVVPNAPTGLTASLAAAADIQLSWTDASLDETSFELQRRRGTGAWSTIRTFTAGVTSYLDRYLGTNATYDYRVRATNSEGPSPWSNIASATVPPGNNAAPAPTAPTNLTVLVVSPTEVQLDWEDQSQDETRFEIERRVGGVDFTQIGFLGIDKTSFPDRTVVAGWPHVWRVRAVAPQGPSSWTVSRSVTTTGTLQFALTTGLLTASPKAKKDKLRLKGTYVLPAGLAEPYDPSATGMRFQAGPTSSPFVLAVPAADPAWKKSKKTGVWTWKSAKKALPAFTLTVDPKKHTFDLNLTAGDLSGDAVNPFRVLVAVGSDGAAQVRDWTEGKGGKFTAPK